MARRKGHKHTAKEHRIHDAILKSSKGKLSDKAAWKITMSMGPKARGKRRKRK